MNLAVVCETVNRYRFFSRMVPAIKRRGDKFIFLSNRLSIVLLAMRDGNIVKLVRDDSSETSFNAYLRRFCGGGIENNYQQLVRSTVNRIFDHYSISACFFWNGSSLFSSCIALAAQTRRCATLFFEIGNFPGKLFVDPVGVNSKSWFAKNYNKIEQDIDILSFYRWRDKYLDSKMKYHYVPQSRISTRFNWLYPVDICGYYLVRALMDDEPKVASKTWQYLRSRSVRYNFDEFSPSASPGYVFFPMQVSTDSQLLVNSNVDNLEALKKASVRAEQQGVVLVVKPHPAESNRNLIDEISHLRESMSFLFVNNNVFELIKHSSCVVTINSTVGLEAMLQGRSVEILGSAIYADFDEKAIALYIMHYLLDIDFFGKEDITDRQLGKIFLCMDNPYLV